MVSQTIDFRVSPSLSFYGLMIRILCCHQCSKEEELNGVDLDWEQPRTREEFNSYVELINEASSALHKEGLILTLALHVGQFFPKQVYRNVDRIHLMTYDMIIPNGADNHHASYKNGK